MEMYKAERVLNMARFIIEGGRRLEGEIPIQGAKNSVLPVLAATLLGCGESVIHNCPELTDVEISLRILEYLGCRVRREGKTVVVDSTNLTRSDVPERLMRQMRSSIVFLGAIISRMHEAVMSAPGGCELGSRPIDLHLMALRRLGTEIREQRGLLDCRACQLRGCETALSFPSVGATENILLCAATAKGTTTIVNAAREPEIMDLADCLNKMGGRIHGAGESTIVIEGVEKLHGFEHTIIPDRIVTATFLSAAAITGGELLLRGMVPAHVTPVMAAFEEMGCQLRVAGDCCLVRGAQRLLPVKTVRTMPYPGFPTDAQAPVMAAATVARGTSVFIESIFDSRFKHVGELTRLGAHIKTEGRIAVVEGVKRLSGAPVESTDLRGGAAVVIAGLAAEGVTEVSGLRHIDRGYEGLETLLSSVGADIRRVE